MIEPHELEIFIGDGSLQYTYIPYFLKIKKIILFIEVNFATLSHFEV